MRTFHVLCVLSMFFVLAGALNLYIPVEARAGESAILVALEGDVQVKLRSDGKFERAVKNMELPEGAELMTGFESAATVRFGDGSEIVIRELSKVKINRMEMKEGSVNTRLELGVGNVRANVSKRQDTTTTFEVKTPMATVSVRGTDKEIWSYADTGTYVYCYEGVVETSNSEGQNVVLGAGDRTRVEEDNPPELPVNLKIEESVVNIPVEGLTKEETAVLPDANGPVETIYSVLPGKEGNVFSEVIETVRCHVTWE